MNIDDLSETLPWGLHDAHLERLTIDWMRRELVLDLRLMITERQDKDQRARLTITGLVYCSIEPPIIHPEKGYQATPATGLRIDAEAGASSDATGLPQVPEGCFLHHLLVLDWNCRPIHICGESVALTWLEEEPMPSRSAIRALYPGDKIPDSGSAG